MVEREGGDAEFTCNPLEARRDPSGALRQTRSFVLVIVLALESTEWRKKYAYLRTCKTRGEFEKKGKDWDVLFESHATLHVGRSLLCVV